MRNKYSISRGQQNQRPSTPIIEVAEVSATKGEWATPAVSKVNLAISLSNFSARWHGTHGIRSEDVSVGTIAICPPDYSRLFVMQSEADFGIISLSNAVFDQVEEDMTTRSELQSHDLLNDTTLKHLMNVLLGERRGNFRSGSFFLESVTFSLASYLLRHYSGASATRQTSAAGLAPSTLRKCIQLIQDNLEGDLRLKDLAHEAKLSISHLIRSFRRSTGDTPYQFLLRHRIERAQSLMRDRRSSLTEVAIASGFADQHHLARVFRHITGVTPTSYRRSL